MKETVLCLIVLASIIFTSNAQEIGSFKDKRDGKVYKTIKIGNQVWMAENLNYNSNSGSWYYGDNSSNGTKYGRLYNYETAKNVCPTGWHLPSKAEYKTLLDNFGGTGNGALCAFKRRW